MACGREGGGAMSIATVHAVYFSGTGTTEKTVRRVAHRLADKLNAA